MRFITVLFLAISITGCSEPRIDASSDKALNQSISEVRDSLPPEKQATFDKAIGNAGIGAALAGLFSKSPDSLSRGYQHFNGMTGGEIVAFENAQEEKRKAEEAAAQARDEAEKIAELERLEAAQKVRDDALAKLTDIHITNPIVRNRKSGFMRRVEFEATIQNGLDIPVARVMFNYAATTPGRAVPWNTGEGTFIIDGGLEAGETRELTTGIAGDFSIGGFILLDKALREHPESVLTVTVVDADSADKKSILPQELSSWDSARLIQLRNELPKSAAE